MSQAFRILTALVAGLVLGIVLAKYAPDAGLTLLSVTKRIGGAWLHGLQMVIVPLVVALLVIGIAASAEAARAGRIAARALIAFVVILWFNTILSAFLTPLLLRLFPLPTEWATALRASLSKAGTAGQVPSLGDFFDKIVPTNIVDAAASDAFLPLTAFAMVFAFAITRLAPAPRKTLLDFFQAVADAMVVIIGWVLVLAPVGVFCLAFGVGTETGAAAFGALAHYIAIVSTLGVLVLLSAYPIAAIGARVGIGRFARAVLPSQVVAVSTSSSLATLPTMLRSSEALGAPASVSGIVLPIAVAVFRATSPAMNLAVALYVAHLTGTPIGPGQLAAGVATAAITTMGSVSLPGTVSFFASVAPVSVAMGVPIEALGLLVAVETVPDLFRTLGNVTMDVAVTATIAARDRGDAPAQPTDTEIDALPG
ncbi:MAG: cation:dicarboxylase symporter family transporter [Sphingomonas sp.]|uniref:dicarboxylate/amino acid:cation symporter n=1 Tax=Sphingomonas sp. TaxID=28214 RepID=UPI001AC4637F|nr:cation:dicarboxylase symporter family transporter [Sphingomonas sp.]MBN8809013.1 cation:dicarboxylase symporter family transporter [Sphingomonas sp.]